MTDTPPAFPTQARVVIIGGGIVGCSVAYHLTQLGWKDVVLAVLVMLVLMRTAVHASSPATPTTIAAFEVGLAAIAFVVREIARRRWSRLDWMLCRAEPGVRASA